MKNKVKIISALALVAAVSGVVGTVAAFAEQPAYYVCYSTENYAVRNANKMTERDGEFVLEDVRLNSLVDFYVTDNSGRRWYASDGDEMSVEETATYSYDLKFSPDTTYSEGVGGWAKTDCNITYAFTVPAEYSVDIGGVPTPLTYNPYRTNYDEFYISSQYIAGGTAVSYGSETHTVKHDGYYRLLFTAGERRGGNDYAYDDKGNYGTGENYKYNLYIEDAPQYFVLPEGGNDYAPLQRYENNVAANEYRGDEFFVPERDYTFRYAVYERDASSAYRLIDDDGDEDTALSKIEVTDAGWYRFSFVDGGSTFATSLVGEKRNFGGYYLAGEFNNYCFDGDGSVYTDGKYRFKEVQDGDDDYDADYKQYLLNFTVTEKQLKEGDVEFYITDGDEKYKNGAQYIRVSRAGTYKILFSDEHFYGNGRRYRYVLEDGEAEYTELEIGTFEEFKAFAENCTASADYSKNLAVYLTADIDFAGAQFVGVGEFSGKFYGGYHTLKNVTLDEDNPSVFEIVKRDGVIERLTVNIAGSDKSADYSGFIGKNYGRVNGVTVRGSVSGNNYVGGVVAYNGRSAESESAGSTDTNKVYRYGTVENCKNYATVSGTVHCGGLVGFNAGEIISCVNEGKISYLKQSSASPTFNLGGIAGYSAGKITDCINSAEVYGGSETLYAGGLVGLCAGEIYFGFNTASVVARRYAGGIAGYFGTISREDDKNNIFGGLTYEEIYNKYFGDDNNFEEAQGKAQIIKYCKNTGAVSSVSYAGGVLGYSEAAGLKISACQSLAGVSATAGSYAGGVCGYLTGGSVENCVSSGSVSAKGLNAGNYVGGILGYGDGVTACYTVCQLIGTDYIGGIVGYNRSGVSSCWSNAVIVPGDGAENVGNIAGFTEALNDAADSFSAGFAYNYYLDNGDGIAARSYGGVGGRSYGAAYDFAALPLTDGELSFVGTVSPVLADGFNTDGKWQGTDELSYPVLLSFAEADECAEFDDEEEFSRLFESHAEKFYSSASDAAKPLFTIAFMEWNEDDGKLYDDDKLQLDNFNLIYFVRVPLGSAVEAPAFKWAQLSGDRYIYEGDEASYFVSFEKVTAVTGNRVIYATYSEIATTVATDGDGVLVEGLFDARTKVELVQSVNGYTLRFSLDGKEVNAGEVIVKFRPDGNAKDWQVTRFKADGSADNSFGVSGNFLQFKYSDGDFFTVTLSPNSNGVPNWGWALIGGAIGLVCAGAAVLIVVLVRKKKNKKSVEGAKQ